MGAAKPLKLGLKYYDEITGFLGVATARAVYLYGCIQVCLQPLGVDKESRKPYEPQWFDEGRLVLFEGWEKAEDRLSRAHGRQVDTTGGPVPLPPGRNHAPDG